MQLIKLLSLFAILFSLCANAQQVRKKKKKLLSSKANGVVTLEVFNEKGKLVDKGAGFFVSPQGSFLVSRHVYEKFHNNRNTYQLKVTDRSGRAIPNIAYGKCGQKNKFDLCLLKAKGYKVSAFFPEARLPRYRVSKDFQFAELRKVFAIGHCGSNYRLIQSRAKFYKKSSYLNKIVYKLNAQDRGTIKDKDLIIMMDSHCPGDSGGPIFTNDGKFVGVLQEYMSDQDGQGKFFIGLAVTEISDFLTSGAQWKNISSKSIIRGTARRKTASRRSGRVLEY